MFLPQLKREAYSEHNLIHREGFLLLYMSKHLALSIT